MRLARESLLEASRCRACASRLEASRCRACASRLEASRCRACASREVCARTGRAATITQQAPKMKRFTYASLNNTRVQFVVVSEHTLGRVVEKLVRIFPGSSQALQNAALQHILGTVALESLFPYAAPNLFHHVALRFEFGSGHDGTRRGHDPGLFIPECEDRVP